MGKDTRHLVLKQIEQSVEIAASPERVWTLVSDLPRLSEWSPQVVKSFLLGARPVRDGSRPHHY